MRFEHELSEPEEARRLALTALVRATGKLAAANHDQTRSINVRDAAGVLVYRITFTLKGELPN